MRSIGETRDRARKKRCLQDPFYSIHRRICFLYKKLSILARVRASCLLRRHQQTDFRSTRYTLEKAFVFSSVLLLNRCFSFFFVFLLEPVDFTRSALSYLGQIAPVAVFTAREGARSVYPGVFGRAVLATLPIGLPRPFLLLRAADIGPTVKTHCLFPPPLREPDGHATYRDDTMGGVGACVLSVAYYARS